jgi:phospho-N-acetylmuramoyl-pentapeptide-transferase
MEWTIFALAGFFGALAATYLFIVAMRRAGSGQPIRDYGPKIHEHKRGTPTMGGAVVLLVFLAVLLAYQLTRGLLDDSWLIVVGATVGFGLIGFIDDAIKFLRQHSQGLPARYKLLLQLLVSVGVLWTLEASGLLEATLTVPIASVEWEMSPPLLYIIAVLAFLGTVNAWNLTDGLDGLACGITLIVLAAYILVAPELEGLIGIFGAVLLGFLWLNLHPARIFLGDTGSMALGGFVAAISVLTGTVFFLLLFAIVPVLEALSVMMQVFSFKLFGRRIFKVSPLHHHFERAEGVDYPYLLPSMELPEWVITLMFWGLTVLFTAVGVYLCGRC